MVGHCAGGICGYGYEDSKIINCVNYGYINGYDEFGGIMGNGGGVIEKCLNYGSTKSGRNSGSFWILSI